MPGWNRLSAGGWWRARTTSGSTPTTPTTSACCSIRRSRSRSPGTNRSWMASPCGSERINLHGFQWTTTMGHTRARYFPPETGGLVFNGDVGREARFSASTTTRRSSRPPSCAIRYGKTGPWVSWTWRYDSGLVAGSVGSLDDALALTGAQQAAIGFFCGSARPTISTPLTTPSARLRTTAPPGW